MSAHDVLETSEVCTCGSTVSVTFGFDRARHLSFSESRRCASCGDASEADGNELPAEIRELFYARDGVWVVHSATSEPVVPRVRLLMELLAVERTEALRRVRAGELFEGTKGEAAWLVEELGKHGVDAVASLGTRPVAPE